MRVFNRVDERYLNSECLYKIKRLGVHLDYFRAHSGLEFDSLKDLCKTSGFESFSGDYASNQTGEPLPFTQLDRIDSHFKDYDLLMALVHDGGRLEDLLRSKSINLDVKGLLKHVLSTSPQSFILKSGLKPGPGANQMYVRFTQELIECFPDYISSILNSLNEKEKFRCYVNLVNIASCVEHNGLQHIRINAPINHSSVMRLTGLTKPGSKTTPYLCELRAHCDHLDSTEDLTKFLACTFMSEVFRRSFQGTDDTNLASHMRSRALSWGVLLKCPSFKIPDFADQLMASALCTSPNLFSELGFSHRNLVGLNVNSNLTGLSKAVSDGPLALLVKPDYNIYQTLNCLEFIHDVDQYFFINDIYDGQGFRHTNSVKILASIGGHCPGAEYALANETIEPENALAVLRMMSALDCYDRYSEDCLVKLMSYYIDRLPTMGPDGILKPLELLEMTGDVRERARLEFRRAYETNPAFKVKFIEKVETLEGLTPEHLRIFSLSGTDLPKTMTRTSRKDRANMLEDELGL